MWSSKDVKIQENNKFGGEFTMLNLDIYSDTYTISLLRISDDNSTYQCEVIISINPPLKDLVNVTLDVTGIEYSVSFIALLNFFTVPTPTVRITPSGPIQGAMVGSPQYIQCTVSTVSGVELSSVMISWMGPRGDTIRNDSRVTISPTSGSGNNYTSSLQFMYLMEGDEGTYECSVMILETTTFAYTVINLINGEYFCFSKRKAMHHFA